MILQAKIRHWAVFNLPLVLVSTSAIGVIAGEWITSAGSRPATAANGTLKAYGQGLTSQAHSALI